MATPQALPGFPPAGPCTGSRAAGPREGACAPLPSAPAREAPPHLRAHPGQTGSARGGTRCQLLKPASLQKPHLTALSP